MNHKDTLGIFPDKIAEQISLLKYSKSSCGVDFQLNMAESSEKRGRPSGSLWILSGNAVI